MGRLNKLSDQNLDSLRDPSLGPLLTALSPPAPTALTAAGGDGIATLTWVSSSTLSQLPITDHSIQYSENGSNWITFSEGVSTSPTAVVTGLTNGSTYFFRVRSINTAGAGAYASTPAAVRIGLPPSAPTGLAGTSGERRVALSWSVPSSNGGLAISDYAIQYSVDSGTTWTPVTRSSASTATSFTVTGLLGQVVHQFRVRAVNVVGPGEWSTVATATPASYDEYWDDVSLLLRMEGTGTSFVDSSQNNTVITSVGASQSTAQKKWGTKSADFAASSNYLSAANGPSTSLTGAFTIEMWVYWKTTPASEGYLFHGANNRTEGRNMSFLTTGSTGQGLRYGRSWVGDLFPPVTTQFRAGQWYHVAVVREADFRIRLFVDGVQLNQSTALDVWSQSAALSGRLFVGYPARTGNFFIDEFRVTKRARYSANFTPPTEPFPTGKRPAAPAAPATATVAIGDGQVTVSWTAVAGVTGYVVEYQRSGGAWETGGSTSSTSLLIAGLANGETYTVRVAAVSDGGQGVWATAAAVTLPTPVSQVTGLTASAGHLQACLSWTTPDGDISDYIVQYNGGSGWETFAHSPTTNAFITVTGLTNGVSYQFRVAATNAVAAGAYSTAAIATPILSLPDAPTAVTGVAGSNFVSLAWTAPASTSCRILTNYLISYSSDSGSSWTNLTPQAATSATATVSGLSNGLSYIFRVAYQSAAGTGPWSAASAAVTPSAPPSPPISVTGTAGDGQAVVSWVAGNDGGSSATDYLLQYSTNQTSWTQVDDGQNTSTTYTVTGLTNGTAYYFRVSTRTAVADSAPTQSAAVTPRGVPGAPGTPSGTAGNGQVSLTWSAAAPNGSTVTGHVVEYAPAGGSPQTVTTGSASTAYTVTGLTNGTAYTFRVQAVNAVGTGALSAASSAVTPAVVPVAPTALAGTIGNGSVAMSWTAPADNGGSAITGYTVEYTPAGGSPLTAVTSSSPYTLTGLLNGTTYSLRVAANSAIGRGEYTAAITRTPATTPGTPTGMAATIGSVSGRLALSWTAPSTGGSAIESYTIEYTPSGGSAQTVSTGTSATSYNLDALTNGTSYSVRVRAVNVVGAGSYSTSASGTPGTVPGTPTSLAGTTGDSSVALSWTAPTDNGGAAITNYTVEYAAAGGGSALTTTASSSPYTLSGLTNGTAYSIRVAANNAAGRGAYTATIDRTPATVPGAPGSMTATSGSVSGRLALSWTAPASTGGSAITSYTVEYTPSGGSAQTVSTGTTATTFNLDGLTGGTSYSVRVRAVNAIGAGSYSTSASGAPATTPGTPTGLTATGGSASGRLALSWTAPSTGGSAITSYTVEYTPSGGSAQTVSTSATSYNLDGLTNGTSYSVRVRAVNAIGAGSYSTSASGTPATVPGAPTALAGTIGNGSVAMSWTAPADNGGAAITNYTVEYTPSGGSAATVTASSSPYTLTGLTNGTTYSIRVAANNAAGRGAYTTAITRTPATVPDSVAGVIVTSGTASGRLALSWTAPSNGGSAITSYTVEYTASGVSAQTVSTGTSATSYNLDGLTNGTLYSVRVRAVNVIGAGGYNDAVPSGTPATVPGAPTSLAGTIGNASVALSWTAPADNGGAAITNYTVEYTPSGGSAATVTATSSPYTLTGLTNGTTYSIRVAAYNSAGRGAYTTAITRTPATTPGTPAGLAATAGNAQVALSWTAPASNGGAAITSYDAQYSSDSGSTWTTLSAFAATPAGATVTGLTNETVYTFRVAAVNAAGRGGWSGTVIGTPDADVFKTSVVAYLRMNGSNGSQTFTDSSQSPKTVTALNGTGITTDLKKCGTGSATNFSNGGIAIANGVPNRTGDFTVECWAYFNPCVSGCGPWLIKPDMCLWRAETTGGSQFLLLEGGISPPTLTVSPSGVSFSLPSRSEWHHFAFVQQGTTHRVYVDGVEVGNSLIYGPQSINPFVDNVMYVGGFGGGRWFDGYIDDFRVTNVCRYPDGTTFTPPECTGETPNSASVPDAPTSLRNADNYWGCSTNSTMWNAPASNGGSAITGYVWRIGSGATTSVAPSSGSRPAGSYTGGFVSSHAPTGSFQVAAVNAVGTGPFASITLEQDCN